MFTLYTADLLCRYTLFTFVKTGSFYLLYWYPQEIYNIVFLSVMTDFFFLQSPHFEFYERERISEELESRLMPLLLLYTTTPAINYMLIRVSWWKLITAAGSYCPCAYRGRRYALGAYVRDREREKDTKIKKKRKKPRQKQQHGKLNMKCTLL